MNQEFEFRIGCLLRWANSDPMATCDRAGFYCLKEAICEAFGSRDGEDIQRIERKCWECGGSGFTDDWDGHEEYCWRCVGGVWDVVYVRLERWIVGGKVFHRPAGRVSGIDETKATIRGLVEHRPSSVAQTAAVALARLFCSHLYWRWLRYSSPDGFGPLVMRSNRLAEIASRNHSMNWRLNLFHTMLELPVRLEKDWC